MWLPDGPGCDDARIPRKPYKELVRVVLDHYGMERILDSLIELVADRSFGEKYMVSLKKDLTKTLETYRDRHADDS